MITICELFLQYLTAYKWLIILKRSKLDGFLDEYVNQDKEFIRLENEYLMCRTFVGHSECFIYSFDEKENIDLSKEYDSFVTIGCHSLSSNDTNVDYFIMIGGNKLRHNVHKPNIINRIKQNFDLLKIHSWYKYGRLHRKGDPAVIKICNNLIDSQEYYNNDTKFIEINKSMRDLLGINVLIK